MKKIVLLAAVMPVIAVATTEPLSMASDHRIVVVPYSENNVVPVREIPLTTTQIIFSKNQAILDVQGGDAGGWSPYWDKNVPYVMNLKLTGFN